MENLPEKSTQNMAWWIISLAISIVCCAILFVLFASYLVNIKEDIAVAKIRMDMSEQRISSLNTEVDILRHRASVQQIQILPPQGAAQAVEGVINMLRGQAGQEGAPASAVVVAPAPAAVVTPAVTAPAVPAVPVVIPPAPPAKP